MRLHVSARALLASAALGLAFAGAGVAQAAGSAEAGKTKSTVCAACHGANGNSANPQWPSLAGQHASYIIAQLGYFKSGQRQNALMSSQAMNLSDEDMADLAAYYSSLPLEVPGAVEAAVSAGPGAVPGRQRRLGRLGLHRLPRPGRARQPGRGDAGDRRPARHLHRQHAEGVPLGRARERDDERDREEPHRRGDRGGRRLPAGPALGGRAERRGGPRARRAALTGLRHGQSSGPRGADPGAARDAGSGEGLASARSPGAMIVRPESRLSAHGAELSRPAAI
jgi:cytochrome c553